MHEDGAAGFLTLPSIPEIPTDAPPRNITTSSSSRMWPFAGNSSSSSATRLSSLPRRASRLSSRRSSGWINLRPPSVLVNDVVPDYVVNFIRGETPESLARRREAGPRAVNDDLEPEIVPPTGGLEGGHPVPRGAPRGVRALATGWRRGVVVNSLVAVVPLLALVVCVALAATTGRLFGRPGPVTEGRCRSVARVNVGIHAVTNVVGMGLVAAAAYVAQILTSPTREEVSRAHARDGWLDIGVPSVRNLGSISPWRAALSVFILLVATAAHIL